MPSKLIVEVCTIDKIADHPNADRLEVAQVKGWQCVVQKDKFKVGDKVVYFPIDSVLTKELEEIIFGKDSKISLKDRRIRTIKLRKVISQGLVVPIGAVEIDSSIVIGTDVKDVLGVTKYVNPTKNKPKFMLSEPAKKKAGNDNFSKYTKINHLSNFPYLFEGERVHIYEKIHGTNFRAGLLDRTPKTWWEKIKFFFNKGKPEFVYGSHNVQLKNKDNDFNPKNVYWKTVENYDIINKLKRIRKHFFGSNKNVVMYGEVYGPGVQGKKYGYGVPDGETRLVVFDIKVDGHYIDNESLKSCCDLYNFPMPYEFTSAGGDLYTDEFVKEKGSGLSKLNRSGNPDKDTPIIEGVVVRTVGTDRKIAKYINPEYLLQKGVTEWS